MPRKQEESQNDLNDLQRHIEPLFSPNVLHSHITNEEKTILLYNLQESEFSQYPQAHIDHYNYISPYPMYRSEYSCRSSAHDDSLQYNRMNQDSFPFHFHSWNANENVALSDRYYHSLPLPNFQGYRTTNPMSTPQRKYRMNNRPTHHFDYVQQSSFNSSDFYSSHKCNPLSNRFLGYGG